MKNLSGCFVILAIVLSFPIQTMPQGVAISNENNYQAEGSSILDVSSDSKGILIPRLTGAQRASISEPATGLMVFDTDINTFCFYDGASWQYLITKAYADSLKQEVKLEIYAELGVDDIDGNHYLAVKIGNQVWMAENLRTTRLNNGSEIPEITENAAWNGMTSPAYCWFFNDSASYAGFCGALYNWYSVGTGNLCPEGWHVPTDTDWTELTNFLGGTSVAGGKMKETGTAHWLAPNNGATNESGFTAIPGGFRYNGSFWDYGYNANWWSSTENTSTDCWARKIYYYGAFFYADANVKNIGFSVRCLKNQ
jgi:uncharacterized protein (TIGR02145 family)